MFTHTQTPQLIFALGVALVGAGCLTVTPRVHAPSPSGISKAEAQEALSKIALGALISSPGWTSRVSVAGGPARLVLEEDHFVVHLEPQFGTPCPFAFAVAYRPATWQLAQLGGAWSRVSIDGAQLEVLESCGLPVGAPATLALDLPGVESGPRFVDLMAALAE